MAKKSSIVCAPLRCARAFGRKEASFFDADPGLTLLATYIPPLRGCTFGLSTGRQDRPQDSNQRKTLAEVNAADFGVVAELLGRASAEDAAIINDVGAIGDGKSFAHVMVGHEHADAGILQVKNNLLKIEHSDGIDAGKRLVEQNERGPDAKRAGDLHPATLAAGERITAIAANVAQAELLDKPLHALAALMPGNRLRLEDCKNVFFHRQLAKDRGLLRQIADAMHPRAQIHRNIGDVFAIEQHPALIERGEADDHIKGGCLAGAVGPEQAHHLTLMDVE